MDIKVHMLAGNHDTYFKNTNDVNSVDLLLREYSNVHIIDTPEEIWVGDEFDSERICMMPWICAENYEDSLKMIKDTSAQICMGHFEIQGFAMFRGMESHEGLSRDIFNKFDVVCSGHYHHKSSSGNIHYLGNPYELTWSDYDDPRGFHIFDTATREFDFIKNPYTIFHKISYDDTLPNAISDISNVDLSEHKDSYVKVIVVNKTNPYLFDLFMSNLYKQNPIDVSIVEDNLDLTEGLESDIISDAEDTLTILNKYVDNIQVQDLDGDRLKSVLKELYVEALNLETI
jgi:DNA repair exonuclease SbcCD nuclease subunit